MVETNIDWRLLREDERLYFRTKEWWEQLHISHSHNITAPPITKRQFGGTAVFSINKAAHRVISKGSDTSGLGRWSWTRFRGKNNHTLRIISAYRPNPPAGPFTVYAQHSKFLNETNDHRCPRIAFLQDLSKELDCFKEEGDHIVLLIDGNSNMRSGDLKDKLEALDLREVLLEKHGLKGPETCKRNTTRTPIDGIWASMGISIIAGGYFDYDTVIMNTDHRCLWVDISYITAFGHNMPAIIRPSARRLNCKDPRLIHNYNRRYKLFIQQHGLLEQARQLDTSLCFPMSIHQREVYEKIEKLRCQGVFVAERRCRKLRMGQVAYSPELQKARHLIYTWSLLLKRAKGQKISSRLIVRSLKKAKLERHLRNQGQAFLEEHLMLAYKHYYLIKGSDKELRSTALDNRAEALAKEGNISKEKAIKAIRQRETQRETAKKIKFLRGKLAKCSTTTVSVPDSSGSWRDITGKEAIEQAIIRNNEEKYQQSINTPFFQTPLVHDFGYKGLSTFTTAVLSGSYEPPTELDQYTQDFISELKTPPSVMERGPQNMEMSLDNYQSFWRKAKENTSCYPDTLSFSTMKAGASDPTIAELDCLLTSIPLKGGYSPERWRKCMDVMIQKRSGVTHLSGLRTIVLFPVDCNYAFKHVGREMMRSAEVTKSLAPEQFGSRKNHRAIDLAVNKTLTYDILRQLKRPGAICSNDAKSCYDLIGHTPASLAMQRVGVPKNIIECLFSTLQNATHQVRTGYGDSESFYGGPNWKTPMHGVGQGNGAGPAIWAVLSTPLLNMLRAKGHGCRFISPISQTVTEFSGYAFVDDTDLIISRDHLVSYQEVGKVLQQTVDTWEGGLKATGGAIVPEKTYWYLIDFHWDGGKWRYKRIDDCPGTILANDITSCRKELRRLEVHEAQETLGIHIAPDGNTAAQVAKMLKVAKQWADDMRTGRISKAEVWLALQSTIWKTLAYPLPATNITREQCEKIMAPLLQYGLPALGVCRNFPRNIVFAPQKYLGLGFQHLYTMQEILRLKDIILHNMRATTTGHLYKTSLELLFIELGLGTELNNLQFSTLAPLATPSLLKSTWQFLSENDIILRHTITFHPQRTNDSLIMEHFLKAKPSTEHLIALNHCRLYLHAYFVSDIADGYGNSITDDAWAGKQTDYHNRQRSWPNQGRPTKREWELWRLYLKQCLLQRGRHLKDTLGEWIYHDPSWPWYYSIDDDCLLHLSEDGWTSFSRIHKRNHRPMFSKNGIPAPAPAQLYRATVYEKGNFWICSGYQKICPSPSYLQTNFITFLHQSTQEERWCFSHIDIPVEEGFIVAEAIINRCAIAVSDGSFQDKFGTAAWVIEGADAHGRLLGKVVAPGGPLDHSPYRSELTGIFALMKMVEKLCQFYHITEGLIEIACDGLSAIDKAFSYVSLLNVDDPSYDLLSSIRHLWALSPISWKIRHVSGHQDDHKEYKDLDRWEKLNVEMDAAAKAHMVVAKRQPYHFQVPNEPWSLWLGETKITRQLSSTLYEVVHSSQAKQYWMTKRSISSQDFVNINWPAVDKAIHQVPIARKLFITKHVVGMCGVGKFMVRWKERDNPHCPRCGAMEDAPHVWTCPDSRASSVWDNAIKNLQTWMESVDTDPDLQDAILIHLDRWRTGQDIRHFSPFHLQEALQSQERIGWQSFFEGWLALEWEGIQQNFYNSLHSRRTGKRWVISIINKLWNIAWDMWDHRNGILHETENVVTNAELDSLNRQLRLAYSRRYDVAEKDRYLFRVSLNQLLGKDLVYKRTWLQQALAAIGLIRQEAHSLAHMRMTMRNWLSTAIPTQITKGRTNT